MDNPQELKKAILTVLAEKGDYGTLLSHLDTDDKKEKEGKMYKLIEPISAFADLLTQNNEGAFMEKLTARLDGTTKKALEELAEEIKELREELKTATQDLLTTSKSDLTTDNLNRYKQAEASLTEKMMTMAVEIVTNKANEILPNLYEGARLTEEEIEDIIEQAAFSVESQLNKIISLYIDEQGISVAQIRDFTENVQKLLPQVDFSKISVDWSQVKNAPSIGGTNTNIVRQIVDEAVAGLSTITIEDEGTPVTQRSTINFVGSGVSVADTGGKTVVTISTGGGSTASETPTGTVDGSNSSFTFVTTPLFIITETGVYIENFGYTLTGLTVTMDIPPASFIRGIS